MATGDGELKALQAKVEAYIKNIGRPQNIFRLDRQAAVFVAVDLQNFVCRPEPGRELPGMGQVIERVNRMADFCHERNIPVIWLRHCFTTASGGDDVGLYGRFHKSPLDPGLFNQGQAAEIFSGMHLDRDRDFVVVKNRYSALIPGSSRLESLLSGLGRSQLIMAGVATNVCVESTARDAMQLGYQVTLLADATTAFDQLVHQVSLINLKMFFGDVKTVDGVIGELSEKA